jgi:hypothetical protein
MPSSSEHAVAAPLGAVGVRHRVVVDRRGDETGEQRGLIQSEIEGWLVEVRLGRGLDPVRTVAEVHRVQVLREDPVFAEPVFELPSQIRLADLASDGLLLTDVHVLHELLGDRGATLDDLAGRRVHVCGPEQRAQIDAVVVVEALVLDRDDGVSDDVRDPA